MLVLNRWPTEALIINNEIKIIYMGQNEKGQGRFVIDAPKDIPIHREEVQKRINRGEPKPSKPYKYCYY